MQIFKTRNDFISSLSRNLIMCEIGVFLGEFSKILFDQQPLELHLIDPFLGNFCSGDKDGLNIKQVNLTQSYLNLINFYSNTNNVIIHREFSHAILTNFPDHYFDFMYIDADHNYESVKQDLLLCKRKTKIGGIISGHDYHALNFPGVYKAVNEFCYMYQTPINSLTEDGSPSYGIINL